MRSGERQVVFHADDFGLNRAVNDGIGRGFAEGLLTSTSLLANAPEAATALASWPELEEARLSGGLASAAVRRRLGDPDRPFDLGIHLNLTQGRPLTGDRFPAALLDGQGRFPGIINLYTRLLRGAQRYAAAIEDELAAQTQFMIDHGRPPTHLNGHQYVEMIPVVAAVALRLLERFRIPAVRVAVERCWLPSVLWPGIRTSKWLSAGGLAFYARRFRTRIERAGIAHPDAFFGTMTAGTNTFHLLRAFLCGSRRFRRAEIAMHPAMVSQPEARSDGWQDPLAVERGAELKLITSAELAEYLAKIGLRLGRMSA